MTTSLHPSIASAFMLQACARKKLKQELEVFLAQADLLASRAHDPVEIVWDYSSPRDQEVVALICSCLAYGRVSLLKPRVREVLKVLGPSPARYLREEPMGPVADKLAGFVYRMTRADDLVDLFSGIASVLQTYGSLEEAYRWHGEHGDLDHLERSSRFVRDLRRHRRRDVLHRGFRYLLPDPADGSACKRLHLFFRWVARGPDGIDLGLWTALRPSQLIMPLDTHTSRICRYLGLSFRKSVDAKMAMEVTESLRLLDAEDPLRYDFALCHLGISGSCIHRRSPHHCPACPIESVCQL